MTDATWKALEEAIRSRWGGWRKYRYGNLRCYGVPSPTGGHLAVEVTLRTRWCTLAVDRWHTTDRREEPSWAWFEEHAWPLVVDAHRERGTQGGVLPSGGGTFAAAYPVGRSVLRDLMIAWVDVELTWGESANHNQPWSSQ